METKTVDLLSSEKAARERGLCVVAIGGGTGLSTLLKGLKQFVLTPAEMAGASAGRTGQFETFCAVVTVKMMAARADACAKNSTCFLPATFATALSR